MSHDIVKWYVSDTPASLHFLHCVVCSAVLESSDLVQPLLKCGKHLCLLLTPVHMWKKVIGCWRMLYLLSTCCRLMLRRLNPKHERIIPKSKISEVFQIEVYHGKSGKRWLWPSQKLYHHQFWWCRRFHPSTLSFIMMQNREDMCRVHEVSPCTVWNPLSMTLLTATSTEQMNVAMSLFAKNSRPQAKQQCHSICYHAIISSRCNWLTWWRMQTYLAQCSAWGIRWFLDFKKMQTVCRC